MQNQSTAFFHSTSKMDLWYQYFLDSNSYIIELCIAHLSKQPLLSIGWLLACNWLALDSLWWFLQWLRIGWTGFDSRSAQEFFCHSYWVHSDLSPVAAGGTLSSVLAQLSKKLSPHFQWFPDFKSFRIPGWALGHNDHFTLCVICSFFTKVAFF